MFLCQTTMAHGQRCLFIQNENIYNKHSCQFPWIIFNLCTTAFRTQHFHTLSQRVFESSRAALCHWLYSWNPAPSRFQDLGLSFFAEDVGLVASLNGNHKLTLLQRVPWLSTEKGWVPTSGLNMSCCPKWTNSTVSGSCSEARVQWNLRFTGSSV